MPTPEKLKSLISLWDEDREKRATTKKRRRHPRASGSRTEAQCHHTPVATRYYSSFFIMTYSEMLAFLWLPLSLYTIRQTMRSTGISGKRELQHGKVRRSGRPSWNSKSKTRETCSYNFVVAVFDFKLYSRADAENTDPRVSAPHNGSQHKRWC